MIKYSIKTGFFITLHNDCTGPFSMTYGPRLALTDNAWSFALQMGRYSVAVGKFYRGRNAQFKA